MENQTENIVSVIVKELPEWIGYEVANFWIEIGVLLTTIIIASIIGFQLTHIKRESRRQNNIDSLNFMGKFYCENIKEYTNIINKIDTDGNDAIFNQDEKEKIEGLLNQFEILSIQVEYAKIDIDIVDSITGNIITSVMGNDTVQNIISESQNTDSANYERIIKLHDRLMNIKNRVHVTSIFSKSSRLNKTSAMNNPQKVYRAKVHIHHIVIQYIKIMYNANIGVKGLALFIVGLILSLGSVYIENGVGIFQYAPNPKIGGMLLNNAGIAIMVLAALLLGTFMSKNKNIK